MYIVELESGVWLADWDGDPGRTLNINNAKRFSIKKYAMQAIKEARRYRPFYSARIKAV